MTGSKHRFGFVAVSLVSSLIVFPTSAAQQPGAQEIAPAMVGADRDEHGCIGSAGYLWCDREAACVRPWELAEEKGFELSETAFSDYCSVSLSK